MYIQAFGSLLVQSATQAGGRLHTTTGGGSVQDDPHRTRDEKDASVKPPELPGTADA